MALKGWCGQKEQFIKDGKVINYCFKQNCESLRLKGLPPTNKIQDLFEFLIIPERMERIRGPNGGREDERVRTKF